jgi:hypothetical protein
MADWAWHDLLRPTSELNGKAEVIVRGRHNVGFPAEKGILCSSSHRGAAVFECGRNGRILILPPTEREPSRFAALPRQ